MSLPWPRRVGSSGEDGRQHILTRPRALTIVPAVLVTVLVIDLLWEVVRANLPASYLLNWPWRLQLLSVEPAPGQGGLPRA
jgi:hypothetical protein